MTKQNVTHSQINSAKITSNRCIIQSTINFSNAEEMLVNNRNTAHSIIYMKRSIHGMKPLWFSLEKAEMFTLKRRTTNFSTLQTRMFLETFKLIKTMRRCHHIL